MSNTTFTSGVVVESAWLNDVNDVVYEIMGNGTTVPTTRAAARANLDVPQSDGTGATGVWPITTSGVQPIAAGGTGQTTAATAFTALKQAASTTDTGVVELATDAEAQAGTSTSVVLTPANMKAAQIQLGTAVTLTTQTTVDFAIPAYAKKIRVMFAGVSGNGTSNLMLQIGDSGGIENTGYLGSCAFTGSGSAGVAFTTGFGLTSGVAAGTVSHGIAEIGILNASTNTWAYGFSGAYSNTAAGLNAGGSKSLSAALTTIRLTTVNGTDQLDAGVVNVSWE